MTEWHTSRIDETIADIKLELARKPMTRDELAEALLINAPRIGLCIARMHKQQPKQAYVIEWRRAGPKAPWAQVFALGDLPDVPKPAARLASELARERAARLKAEAEAEKAKRITAPNVITDALSWIPRRAA
jgi:hypothetical protein